MAKFEIRIAMNDDGDFVTDADIPRGTESHALIYGLWCHIQLLGDCLKKGRKQIILMAAMTNQLIDEHPDAVQSEKTQVVLPSDLSGIEKTD